MAPPQADHIIFSFMFLKGLQHRFMPSIPLSIRQLPPGHAGYLLDRVYLNARSVIGYAAIRAVSLTVSALFRIVGC